jgi:carboxypeptidase C (cathepsin A)
LLYLESPPGVGFSEASSLEADDNTATEDNYAALVDFFTNKFPEFSKLPFYISGESYSGIYVPYLAQKIVKSGKINL